MQKLIEYICDELNELDRKAGKDGKLSMAEIEYADKLSHIKKSLLAADELWEGSEYSEAGGGSGQTRMGGVLGGNSYRRGSRSSRRMDGGGGSSYARGRGRNARRDSMGRYSSTDGYSGAEEEDFRMELEELIEDAPNEHIKQKMRELMREM